MMYNTGPEELSVPDWKAVWRLPTVLPGNQERLFAWKRRQGILLGFPKAHTTVSFISASFSSIPSVEFTGGFPLRKLKMISSPKLFEPHPSSYLLLSMCLT